MRFTINLRGDLVKLSDAELAIRLEQAWQRYNAAREREAAATKLWYSRRGPLRHPWAYRLLSVVGVSNGFGMYFGLGQLIRRGYMDMHLTLCEIRDLNDEIGRRVTGKPARLLEFERS
jgi:hypothetical protein